MGEAFAKALVMMLFLLCLSLHIYLWFANGSKNLKKV